MYILIEDSAILNDYIDKIRADGDTCFTEDPYVYEFLLKKSVKVISLSSLLSREKIQNISLFSSILSQSWVKELNDYYSKKLAFELDVGRAINMNIYNFISTAFYKYSQLMALNNKNINVEIPCYEFKESSNELISFHNNRLLNQLSEFSEFKNAFQNIIIGPLQKLKEKPYQVIYDRKLRYLANYMLGFCSVPALKYPFMGSLIKKRKNGLRLFSNKDKLSVLVLVDGALITVQQLYLLLKGGKIEYLDHDKITPHTSSEAKVDDKLKNILIENVSRIETDINKEKYSNLIDFLAHKLSVYINSYIIPTSISLHTKLIDKIELRDKEEKSVIFAGSIDPISFIISAVYSKFNIPTILFQEGTSCLLKLYRGLVPLAYINGGDAFVAYAPHEENYYKKITKRYSKPFYTFGADQVMGAPFPKVSRFLARKIWNISQKKNFVIYIPTRYHGKVVRPLYDFCDIDYWMYQKKLILNVFAKATKDVYIKIHKKGLLSTPDKRKYPLDVIDLPDNIIMKESPDMRFMRMGGDLLIVDVATSTLGWAITSGVPVVYMNNELSPLEDEVYNAIKGSVFLIDVKVDGDWVSKLLELMKKPITQIREEWEGMAEKRHKFMKYYITGERRAKNDFYNWVKYISDLGVDELRKMNLINEEDNTIKSNMNF